MNNKTYTVGNVSFRHVGRGKWEFNHVSPDNFSFSLTEVMKGGKVVAEKIANQVRGSMKRNNGRTMDNLGRNNIRKILHLYREN